MKTFLILVISYLSVCESAFSQVKKDVDKVFFQLNYKPGDWITISSTRNSSCVAVGYRTAYIATSGGVLRYDIVKKQFDYPLTTSSGMLDNDVRVVAIDRQNDFLWAATKTGLQVYNPASRQFTTATLFQIGLHLNEEIHSIGFEISRVWIQTNQGFLSSSNSLFGFTRDNLPDTATPVWFGLRAIPPGKLPHIFTNSETGFRFDDYEKSFVDNEFRKFPLSWYGYDHLGNLWLTTNGAGTWKANNVSFLAEPLRYGLAMEDVSAICFDDVTMWAGGNLRSPHGFDNSGRISGVTKWNQENDVFHYYDSGFRSGLNVEFVNCLLTDKENLWVGTGEGLIRNIKSMDYWTTYGANSGLYHPIVYSLALDNRTLYIGTEQGINVARPKEKEYVVSKMEIPELFNTPTFKMLISGRNLWLGTGNGIFSIALDGKTLAHYSALGFEIPTTAFVDQQIRGIAEDSTDVYFASELGIVHYNKHTHLWQSIPVNTQYLSPGVNDAVCDNTNLWVATNSGVLKYTKEKKKWVYYGTQDGLAGERVKQILIDGDYVWFATNKGLTQFYWNAPHLIE